MSKVDYGSIGPGSNVRRDMNLARMAYEVNDVAASINAHQRSVAVEGHREDGDSIKSIVYGGLDGVLTAFAIISGAAGGSLSPTTVLVLGVSNIFADAFAMGVGDTVSTIAYHEHVSIILVSKVDEVEGVDLFSLYRLHRNEGGSVGNSKTTQKARLKK
mmetsp:Transcript_34229/g.54810  ORF Transcript_34229/g.54810 Transcript_34229/m.54810 type:complete len:159 (-) Transcript_34229:479-955(-)